MLAKLVTHNLSKLFSFFRFFPLSLSLSDGLGLEDQPGLKQHGDVKPHTTQRGEGCDSTKLRSVPGWGWRTSGWLVWVHVVDLELIWEALFG